MKSSTCPECGMHNGHHFTNCPETPEPEETENPMNPNTPTPRTDALILAPYGNYFSASASDFRDLARTLERELAEAKAEFERLDNLRVSAENYAADFRKERDQLRAEVDRLETAAHDAVDYVGAANYRERQEEAHASIDSARAKT